jgi:hypothetical protein
MGVNPFARNVTAGTTYLSVTNFQVYVNTSAGAVTLYLPSISDIYSFSQKQGYANGSLPVGGFTISDISNNASVNNITIYGGSGNNFSGNINSYVINTNNSSVVFKVASDTSWNVSQSNNTNPTNAVILLGQGSNSSYRCGQGNTASSYASTVLGVNNIDSSLTTSTISGGNSNSITNAVGYSTITGGSFNQATGCNFGSTISGNNNIIDTYQCNNTPNSVGSTIGGGNNNCINGGSQGSVISGGGFNVANSHSGYNNGYNTISGGYCNTTSSYYGFATISGGVNNTICLGVAGELIAGGYANTMSSCNPANVISGGLFNTISSYSCTACVFVSGVNLISGGAYKIINGDASGSIIL